MFSSLATYWPPQPRRKVRFFFGDMMSKVDSAANAIRLADSASILSSVVNQHIDWESWLRLDNCLRIFYGSFVELVQHPCSKCNAQIVSMIIGAERICVDADYFVEMDSGTVVFELNDLQKVECMPSTILLPSYALSIKDIQNEFVVRINAALARKKIDVNFEREGEFYRNICVECGHAHDEAEIIELDRVLFERMTMHPSDKSPLVLNCRLEPILMNCYSP